MKKLLFLFIISFFTISISVAQEKDSLEIYRPVQIMPKFPGGEDAMFKFIEKHLVYPSRAKKANITGIVYLSFIVEKDGTLSNVKISNGTSDIGGGCAKEAIRMVNLMPNWTPGTQRGNVVRVSYVLPVQFELDDDKKKDFEGEIYMIVQEMPQYPGGEEALLKFIAKNTVYPAAAKNADITGLVYISFVVERDGSISTVKLDSLSPCKDSILSNEALRVVKLMPNWKPGIQRGKTIRVSYILPFDFTLSGDEKETKKTKKKIRKEKREKK